MGCSLDDLTAVPKAASVTTISHACTSPTVQKSCQELFQRRNKKCHPKLHNCHLFQTVNHIYMYIAQAGIVTFELHFLGSEYSKL